MMKNTEDVTASTPASGSARASAIVKDILDNHLPRVIEGLKVGYVDENQILVMYDHAVRARVMNEQSAVFVPPSGSLFQCPKCGGCHFNLTAAAVLCASVSKLTDFQLRAGGCGWSGARNEKGQP